IITSFSIRRSYERREGSPRRERLPWPKPTERSRKWTVRYALVAYVVTFAVANGLGLFLLHVVDLHIHVGVGVLIVDACLLAGLLPLRNRIGLSPQDLGLRATRGVRSILLVILGLVAYGGAIALWAVTLAPHSTYR